MGDRVSIRFINGDEKSEFLFNHWGGLNFVKIACKYVKRACAKNEIGSPEVMMNDFYVYITQSEYKYNYIWNDSDLYFSESGGEGDNNDNGNFDIDLNTIIKEKDGFRWIEVYTYNN